MCWAASARSKVLCWVGILLGIIETLLAAYVSPMFKDGFAFLVLVVVLIIRPKGILGEPVSQRV